MQNSSLHRNAPRAASDALALHFVHPLPPTVSLSQLFDHREPLPRQLRNIRCHHLLRHQPPEPAKTVVQNRTSSRSVVTGPLPPVSSRKKMIVLKPRKPSLLLRVLEPRPQIRTGSSLCGASNPVISVWCSVGSPNFHPRHTPPGSPPPHARSSPRPLASCPAFSLHKLHARRKSKASIQRRADRQIHTHHDPRFLRGFSHQGLTPLRLPLLCQKQLDILFYGVG